MGGFYGDQKTVQPQEFDPLYSQSGAAPIRKGIFDALPDLMKQGQADSAQAIGAARGGAAALNPVMRYGQDTLAGKYLGGGPVQGYLSATRNASNTAAQAGRAASDQSAINQRGQSQAALQAQQADVRNKFARSGQTFGTGGAQAQQAGQVALQTALGRSEADRQSQLGAVDAQRLAGLAANENGVLTDNYQKERAAQAGATGVINSAASNQLNMLQAIPGMEYSGIEPAVGILRNLAGGGTVINPNTYYKPGVGDYALQAVGTMASAGGGGY